MASTEASGLVSTLKKAGLVGYSTYNPKNADNNCVFVTLAKLMGLKDVNALNAVLVKQMENLPPTGLDFDKVVDVLKENGHEFVWKSWWDLAEFPEGSKINAAPPVKAGSQPTGSNVAGMRDEQFLLSEWRVEEMGIIFMRPEKIDPKTKKVLVEASGHCLVMKEGGPGKEPSYMCYQGETNGKESWEDVRGTKGAPIGEGTDLVGAFALVTGKGPLELGGPKRYEQPKPNTPSATTMMTNTAVAIAQPAVGALGNALVAHATGAAPAKH